MNQTTQSEQSTTSETVPAVKTSAGNIAAEMESAAAKAKAKITDEALRMKDEAVKLKDKASTKASEYADAGKSKASDALDGFSSLLRDAAGSVDEKLGENYGQYARKAADAISGAATSLRAKDMSELTDDAREFVRKSPVLAVGAAAAVGFVLARLLTGGNNDKA